MNLLLTDVTALTDDGVKQTAIAVADGRIRSMCGAPDGFAPEQVLDGSGKLCIPGLCNCHTHLYMSLFRNYADDLAFDDWLFGRILPKEDTLTEEDAYWGAMLSCIELLKSGTCAVCDMHMFPSVTPRVAKKLGIRAVVTRGLTGPEGGERRLREAIAEYEEWKDEPLLSFMLAPHAVYTCDESYLRTVASTAERMGLPIHTHLSESEQEVRDCYREHGCSPVRYLERLGLFANKTLAAHCVHLSEDDMEILAKNGVSVAHNPKSNLKLANGVAPIRQLLERGVNVCLGTDGAGSNNSLNLFSEMQFACLLPKGMERDGRVVSADEVFRMASVNGARALSLASGELKEGALADLVLMNLHTPAFCPNHDPVHALCYAANGSEVDTVLVGGEVVLEHGKPVFVDENEVYERVAYLTRTWKQA